MYRFLKRIMWLDINTKLVDLELITDNDKSKVLKWGRGNYIQPIYDKVYELIDKNTTSNIAINYNDINISYQKLKEKN
jgi:hypothetical protein